MFYNNFKTLCDEKGIKPTPLLKSLGISPGNLSKWRNGTIPTGDILIKLADYFYVSTDYLLGRTEEPSLSGADEISGNAAEIAELFSSLTETQQGELIGRAKMMIEQNEAEYRQEDTG